MRKIKFANGEYYHIYNRGVDKRKIICDEKDANRFIQGMKEFNTLEPIGSIYAAVFRNKKAKDLRDLVPKKEKLAGFICYCVNPNHFHFILCQTIDDGISKFMHRLGSGYTSYFNQKYKRSGSLFQGPFQATHINSDEYLLHTSVYVNLNNKVHDLKNVIFRSSWKEYSQNQQGLSEKGIILDQFRNTAEYENFAKESVQTIKEKKELEKNLLLDE